MIDLHFFPTPNGHKISIALEELALPYTLHLVDITKGQQFEPAFLEISPNNKIPAIVDTEGPGGAPLALFESGAILVYLARKTGKLLPSLADAPVAHYQTLQWLMFQVGGIGPMLGQAHHFRIYAPEKIDYAIDRYTKEAQRLYRVVDGALARHAFLAGDTYSIADIATFPWMTYAERQGVDLEPLPHLRRWLDEVGERPAVKAGLAAGPKIDRAAIEDEEARKNLFGDKQYDREVGR